MPYVPTYTFAANTPAVASQVNQNFTDVATLLDGTLPLNELADGTSGQIIVCNASGVPTYVAMSGDATISNTGAVTLAAGAVDSSAFSPTIGFKSVGVGTVAVTSTLTDVTGSSLAITPTVASKLLVTGHFAFRFQNTVNYSVDLNAIGYLNVDGVNETRTALAEVDAKFDSTGNNPGFQTITSQSWVVSLTAAAHTIKLQVNGGVDTGTNSLIYDRTGYSYFLVAA